MRKAIFTIALILTAIGAPVFAQVATTPYSASWYFATSFQLWSINGQSPNTYIFQGRSLCSSQGQNVPFFDFNTNAPVWIADANTANSEVKTPSAIVNTAGSCGVTIAPSNNHYNFQLRSGTAGLQEGIDALDGQGAWPTLLILDKNWWSLANNIPSTYATAILGAAKGDYTVLLEDITTSPATFYVWSGTAYTATNANLKNTAPTMACGAAAGGSPTCSNVNGATGIVGTANVLTGTSPTTGTIFTETWPAVSAGGPQYDGTCTVKSSGTNSYTTFTVTMSDTGSGTTFQRIMTVAEATAPQVAATQYYFTWTCK